MELASLYDYIPRRLSVRDFIHEPVDTSLIEDLEEFISSLDPPGFNVLWDYEEMRYIDMLQICSREPGVKAPHYLLLRAQGKTFHQQAAGYVGEMAALWLCSRGLGSCWQGGITVAEDFPGRMGYMASLAFGATHIPMRESEDEFRRKNISKMVTGHATDDMMEMANAVRLSPSSFNHQPVRLMFDGDKIHVFRKTVFMNTPLVDEPQKIDVGVAVCHLELAAMVKGYNVKFEPHVPKPYWGGKIYQTTAYLTPMSDLE